MAGATAVLFAAPAPTGARLTLGATRLQFREHPTGDVEDGRGEQIEGKWIYVFKVRGLRRTPRISIAGEALAKGGRYEFVNWARGHRNKGLDRRKTGRSNGSYNLWVDKSVDASYVLLSAHQLPYHRIEDYLGSLQLLSDRAVLVDRSKPWMTPAQENGQWIMHLVDPLQVARRLRKSYERAQDQYEREAGDPKKSLERMHGHLTWLVASEVAKDDSDAWDWIQKKALRKWLDRQEQAMLRLQKRRDARARTLTNWMSTTAYRKVRDDFGYESKHLLVLEAHEAEMIDGFLHHAIGQGYLEKQVRDSQSWFNRYLYDQSAFESVRKTGEARDALVGLLKETAAAKIKLKGLEAAPEIMLSTKVFFSMNAEMKTVNGVKRWVGVDGWQETYSQQYTTNSLAKNDAKWKNALGGKYTPHVMAMIQTINLMFAGKALADSKTTGDKIQNSVALAGSVADAVAALEYVLVHKLGEKIFKVAGVVGAVLDYVGAIWNLANETARGNVGLAFGYGITAAGATLVGAGGALELAGGGAAFGAGAASLTLIGAAIVLIGALVLYWFTETPLEEWLKDSRWGSRSSGKSLRKDLTDLLRIIGHPRVRVRLNPYEDPRFEKGLSGNLLWLLSKKLRVALDPLFFLEGQTSYEMKITVHCDYEGSVRGVDEAISGSFDFLKNEVWDIPSKKGKVHRENGQVRSFSQDWFTPVLLGNKKLFPAIDRIMKIKYSYEIKARFARALKDPIRYKGSGVAFDIYDYQMEHQD